MCRETSGLATEACTSIDEMCRADRGYGSVAPSTGPDGYLDRYDAGEMGCYDQEVEGPCAINEDDKVAAVGITFSIRRPCADCCARIDEVHMLKEARGATLEAVVSRMKSIGTEVRFIALSATVPNPEDIAAWLGMDPARQDSPAHIAKFGEDFRPVKLQKFVCGIPYKGNDWGFDSVSDRK